MMLRIAYRMMVSLFAGLLLLLACLLVVAYFYAKTLPDLSFLHKDETVSAYRLTLDLNKISSFDHYLQEETKLFDRLKQLTDDKQAFTHIRWSRYHPSSPLNAQRHPVNWNQSFVLRPESPRAGVVLIHGLSDSPYSLRALGEKLYADNVLVVGLRVPGHGTVPAALREMHWRDFRQAVKLAAEWMNEALNKDQPFYMIGYSNGAALISDYYLQTLDDDSLRAPDKMVMLSPAMKVGAIAAFAKGQRLLSALPGMDKLAWVDVVPEYDPYKYNSFPVAAGEQIYQLTRSIQQRLAVKSANGQLTAFPPLMAFQSMVDATIPADSIISGLMDYLPQKDSQLILFNVNSSAEIAPMLRTNHQRWLDNIRARKQSSFAIKVIRNRSKDLRDMEELLRPSLSEQWQRRDLPLQWPPSVYSLSHVALPIPSDDPWYGRAPEGQSGGVLRLGSMEKRGERGVFGVSMDQLSRLRYNPFYSYVENNVMDFLALKRGDIINEMH